MVSFLIFLITGLLVSSSQLIAHARIFTFELHHRFSDPVKKLAAQRAGGGVSFPVDNWPAKGSLDYYTQLATHDRFLHGRRLSKSDDGKLTFADGNSTFRISSLGFLHYATVTLGTPGMKFLVALDTGSDLFWVPCDCGNCTSTDDSTLYNSDFALSIYNLNGSSTSKKVTCSNSFCYHRNNCLGTFSHCPYSVSYLSSETSTSGILVEDILHLKTDDDEDDFVQAYVVFGCGQVQTGSFLDVAAPNGLFGLGFEKISVPSILSQEGYIADSFSMCFGHDGVGRINFGDKGSLDQEETPFNLNPLHPRYNVSVAQIRVGTNIIDSEFAALFDTGTSFTYLEDPSYTKLTESFHSQIQDARYALDPRIPFEYCYEMSPNSSTSLVPTMSLTMKGGGHLVVYDPIIVMSMQSQLVYCLAVLKSQDYNIIGQNFMTGYRFVFDREKATLGWKKFDCYDIEKASMSLNKTSVQPAVAVGQGGNATATEQDGKTNFAQKSFAFSVYQMPIFGLIYSCLVFLALLV
ncbi:PREDICTED: aspartyl protease family protein 1 isoform X2 [Ipomoea nil]|uniref:aspartyl protease family protein 1 isoform X2 n=1 Tax=Ipomoea nil TaxID=35883 RepID=UPI0009018F35|nr:PREDICTED: aspartyl protease family protein 1 isoform X2 [Ipomoea nil]